MEYVRHTDYSYGHYHPVGAVDEIRETAYRHYAGSPCQPLYSNHVRGFWCKSTFVGHHRTFPAKTSQLWREFLVQTVVLWST